MKEKIINLRPEHKYNMPVNTPYPGENRKMFSKRMGGNRMRNGMVGAAKRSIGSDMMNTKKMMKEKEMMS